MPEPIHRRLTYAAKLLKRRGVTEVGYEFFAGRRDRKRPTGQITLTEADQLGLCELYDLDAATLASNKVSIQQQLSAPRNEPQTVRWLLPHFANPFQGGVSTALRIADHFAAAHGVKNRFCIYNATGSRADKLGPLIAAAFPRLAGAPIEGIDPRVDGSAISALEPVDATVATFWTSAFVLAKSRSAGAKFYLVQDFEPDFYAASSASALADQTYRLGIPGIVNTPGLASVYRSYGNSAVELTPAVDRSIYSPPTTRSNGASDRPVKIVFYGRPGTARNAFGLGVSALYLVMDKFGSKVEIVSVGEDFSVRQFGQQGWLKNAGRLPSPEAVADLYRSADIGFVLMFSKHPSYQPFEYMATGTATVSNDNADTRWFLRNGDNCLTARPFPGALADAIGKLVEDPELRAQIASRGAESIAGIEWADQLESIWEFVAQGGKSEVEA